MSRLIRLDQTGHTELAQWSPGDDAAFERARSMMDAELARGYFAIAGADRVVASPSRCVSCRPMRIIVILRRPIAGG